MYFWLAISCDRHTSPSPAFLLMTSPDDPAGWAELEALAVSQHHQHVKDQQNLTQRQKLLPKSRHLLANKTHEGGVSDSEIPGLWHGPGRLDPYRWGKGN
jgi:hypothetical protein